MYVTFTQISKFSRQGVGFSPRYLMLPCGIPKQFFYVDLTLFTVHHLPHWFIQPWKAQHNRNHFNLNRKKSGMCISAWTTKWTCTVAVKEVTIHWSLNSAYPQKRYLAVREESTFKVAHRAQFPWALSVGFNVNVSLRAHT